MKKTVISCLLLALYSCNDQPKYYHGYVLDRKMKPISNVKVIENNKIPLSTITDSTGYFRLNKNPDWLSNLIFLKEGYITDTVRTVWSKHGEKIEYTFLNQNADTVLLRKVTLPNN